MRQLKKNNATIAAAWKKTKAIVVTGLMRTGSFILPRLAQPAGSEVTLTGRFERAPRGNGPILPIWILLFRTLVGFEQPTKLFVSVFLLPFLQVQLKVSRQDDSKFFYTSLNISLRKHASLLQQRLKGRSQKE